MIFGFSRHLSRHLNLRAFSGLLLEKQWKALVFTLGVQFVVLLCGLATLRGAALSFGSAGFGEYSIARRAYSFLNFPLLLGLGISIPRYIAFVGCPGQENRDQYIVFISGLAIGCLILIGFCISAVVFTDFLSQAFYGDVQYSYMVVPIVVATAGIYLYSLAYAYFRGHLRLWRAGFLQVIVIAVTPWVVITFFYMDAPRSILWIGLIWLVASIIVIGFVLWKHRVYKVSLRELRNSAQKMLVYGIGRVPGELAYFGFYSIPTFIVSRTLGVEQAGFFSFGITLLQILSMPLSTLGTLLLPYVSRLAAQVELRRIQSVVYQILVASLVLTACEVTLVQIVMGYFIPELVGESFVAAIPESRWLVGASIPFACYVVLRNPLDAMTRRPYNSINMSVVFMLTCSLIWFNVLPPAIVVFLGAMLLAILSLIAWRFVVEKIDVQSCEGGKDGGGQVNDVSGQISLS